MIVDMQCLQRDASVSKSVEKKNIVICYNGVMKKKVKILAAFGVDLGVIVTNPTLVTVTD